MICVRRRASIFSVLSAIHDVKSKKRPLIIAFIRIVVNPVPDKNRIDLRLSSCYNGKNAVIAQSLKAR